MASSVRFGSQYTQTKAGHKQIVYRRLCGILTVEGTGQDDMVSQGSILEMVRNRIRADGLIRPGDRVLVACSGGADSTALLDILYRLRAGNKGNWRLGVVHVDHGQHTDRARAAGTVRSRCRRWRLPFWNRVLDPERFPPGSSEAALRDGRYQALIRVASEQGFSRIATGHTASDQVETVLMRILRGTGTGGLKGIPAMREGLLIRPLLDLDRDSILAYLRSRRLTWSEDPTNEDIAILRNRIRHELLPRLRRTINPAVDQALLRLSAAAARDDRALDHMASDLEIEARETGRVSVDLADLTRLPQAVQARVVLRMVRLAAGAGANLEQAHLERLLQKLRPGAGRRWRLGLQTGLQARAERRRLVLCFEDEGGSSEYSIAVTGPGVVRVPSGGWRLDFRLVGRFSPHLGGPRRVFFDAGQVPFPLTVRSSRAGDRMRKWGGAGTRKVARMLADARVPAHLRPGVPLLVKDGRVLWVAGVRRSDAAPVTAGCKSILAVRYLDGT